MKTDTYTKAILTVIAVCLIWMCVQDTSFIQSAHAEEAEVAKKPVRVEIVNNPKVIIYDIADDIDENLPIQLRSIELPDDDSLPVMIDDVRLGITNKLPIEQ